MRKGAPPSIPGLVFVQPLGSGGYADVYLYEQQSPRMPVAVKVLKSEGLTDALRGQFVTEADTMAQLGDHPYIVQVFRSGTSEDHRPYLVMKYYPPPNLAARARQQRFTVEEVLRTGIQLASAVETAHRAHIVHRDIKPGNVLISAYGAPGLTDFGIAGRGRRTADLEAEQTDDVGVSVPWAPPEVLYGQSNGDERADVYSLAATLWQLLVGRSPFEVPGGDNGAYALMPRIRSTPVPPTAREEVPAGFERLLAQAMAKQPDRRPASALELARALQAVEQQQRLARTPIVVLDEQGHTTLLSQPSGPGGAVLEDEDRTRVRAPQTVIAQPSPEEATRRRADVTGYRMAPPPRPAAGPPASAGSAAPLRSQARTDPVVTGQTSRLDAQDVTTTRRASVAGSATGATGQSPAAPGRAASGTAARAEGTRAARPVLVGALAAGVVALLGVVVFLMIGPDGDATTDPATPPQPVGSVSMPGDDSAIGDGVFTKPVLEADGGTGSVTFRWTYESPLGTDTFRLYVGPSSSEAERATPLVVKTARHTVRAKPGTRLCAVVQVNRGGQGSPVSDPQCEVAQ
ncbi:MAG: serine/threonine protein kinase [Intrasporangium sp.]|uniref:serine/threonine-protein kinase n=1 Tax=Intrasporangium sp. TaxID=1925024 RepID=UPI002649A663|nr:serine/threonine-protein kinase [Intrasporangium sp.]MDN5795271.1 serine/threonine protein kinase [Intrasporangium sp.]